MQRFILIGSQPCAAAAAAVKPLYNAEMGEFIKALIDVARAAGVGTVAPTDLAPCKTRSRPCSSTNAAMTNSPLPAPTNGLPKSNATKYTSTLTVRSKRQAALQGSQAGRQAGLGSAVVREEGMSQGGGPIAQSDMRLFGLLTFLPAAAARSSSAALSSSVSLDMLLI